MSSVRKPLTKIVEYPVRELSLKSIEVLPDQIQTRAETNVRRSKRYAAAKAKGSEFPAVVVFETPDDRLLLADGFHRWHAWDHLGLRSIPAQIRKGTIEDAILFGIEANLTDENDNVPTKADRLHAAEIMIRNPGFRQWPNAVIAKRCGVPATSVARIRLRLRDESSIAVPERIQSFRDGKPTGGTKPYSNRPTLSTLEIRDKAAGWTSYLGEGFDQFLAARGVRCEWAKNGLGGLLIGGTIVLPMRDNGLFAILREVGRACLQRQMLEAASRVIIVGWFGQAHGACGKAIGAAQSLSPPIEFMTPDELIAEFAPKGDATTGEPDDPCPA